VTGILLCLRLAAALRFKTSWLSVCFHPVGYSLALLIAVNSFWQAKTRGISWKDRIYREPVPPERSARLSSDTK